MDEMWVVSRFLEGSGRVADAVLLGFERELIVCEVFLMDTAPLPGSS